MSSYTFKSALTKIPYVNIDLDSKLNESSDEFKKRCRIKIAVENSSNELGFLHACLVTTNFGSVLIAGKSGSGKTTIGEQITSHLDGAKITANDWVAVEKEDDAYFASDLNYENKLNHFDRSKIIGIIFLSENDERQRDAYYPNKSEFKNILDNTLDSMSRKNVRLISKFWLHNYENLPFVSAIPNNTNSLKQTYRIIKDILWRYEKLSNHKDNFEIGIVGAGAIGSTLAYKLNDIDTIKKISLYDKTAAKSEGIALDLSHSSCIDPTTEYRAVEKIDTIFNNSHIVFITLRDNSSQNTSNKTDVPERMRMLHAHLRSIDKIAETVSRCSFKGIIFMITNPSDILSYALWKKSQKFSHPLKTYQVFGLGMELDKARAIYYHNLYIKNPKATAKSLSVYGNHMANLKIKQNSTQVKGIIEDEVKDASKKVRALKGMRTIFGPTSAFLRNTRALLEGGTTTLTAIENNCFIGSEVSFSGGLPNRSIDEQFESIIEDHRSYLANYDEML